MKKFVFEIEEAKIVIEKAKTAEFTPDDFEVSFTIGTSNRFLYKDSLYYEILPTLEQFFGYDKMESKQSLDKKELLSKRLFDKKEDCFDDVLYQEFVLFFSGYMIALPKYNDEIYLEIAKMNVFEDKGLYYKQIFLKKIPFNVYQKWNSVFEDLRECSEKLHKELFEELQS